MKGTLASLLKLPLLKQILWSIAWTQMKRSWMSSPNCCRRCYCCSCQVCFDKVIIKAQHWYLTPWTFLLNPIQKPWCLQNLFVVGRDKTLWWEWWCILWASDGAMVGPSDIGNASRPPKSHQRETFWLRNSIKLVGVLWLILCDWEEVEFIRSPFTPAPSLSFSAEIVYVI